MKKYNLCKILCILTCTTTPLSVNAQTYAYVVNARTNAVNVFKVDSNGSFDSKSMRVYPTSLDPEDWGIYNNGKNLYTLSWTENKVSTFNIDQKNGGLTPLSPRDVITGMQPWNLAMTPDNKCGYTGDSANSTITNVQISTNGTMTNVGKADYDGKFVRTVGTRVDLNGNYLLAMYQATNNIRSYKIDKATCKLTPTGYSSDTPMQPARLRIIKLTNEEQFAYAVNSGNNSVAEYWLTIGGVLNKIGEIQTGGVDPIHLFSPDGKNAYVPNRATNNISWFTIGSDGKLTLKGLFDANGGVGARNIAFDKLAQNMYVANQHSNTFSRFKINLDGSLKFVETIPSGGVQPFGVSFLDLP